MGTTGKPTTARAPAGTRGRCRARAAALTALLAAPSPAAASDFAQMSLQELMQVNVTTLSRYPQPLRETPAAVSVVTREDIKRAGAATVPDALRLVPGVQVARINSGAWAITARGFNDQFANTLLVMIDGRPIYTAFFSGVLWHRHDLALDNVKQIEVIRGPGGAIWGANAVNGIINIITRTSAETQGSYARLTAGNVERAVGVARHGTRWGEGHLRVTAKARRRADGESADGRGVDDPWTMGKLSFRGDRPVADGKLRVTGGARRSVTGIRLDGIDFTTFQPTVRNTENTVTAGHLTGRWRRQLDSGGSVQLFGFYDHSHVESQLADIMRDRLELRGRHRFSPWQGHDLTWGLRARVVREAVDQTRRVGIDQRERVTARLSVFAQDTISLSKQFDVILGSKLSYNSYTGVEVQPSARARWRLTDQHMLWSSVARAVRVPSRVDNDARITTLAGTTPQGAPIVGVLNGTDRVESVNLTAFEAGYKGRPVKNTRLAVSAFYNIYDDLIEQVRTGQMQRANPPRLEVTTTLANPGEAESYGVEVEGSWQVAPPWRLTATYSAIEVEARNAPPASIAEREGGAPAHQGTLRSRWQPREDLRLDATLRARDSFFQGSVDAMADLDLRVAWDPRPGLTLALTGRNLVGGERRDFAIPAFPGTGVTKSDRSVFATLEARF